MKKNFIKKTLASTLAFAMVASVVPVAPAAAAKAPALNKSGKVLYLNENEVGSTFNFNVVNQVKGSTYKWASADKTIATVNAKTGVVTAQKVGTVKVTCKITLPTKKTKTLTATVAVKENAVKAAISNPTEKIGVNEEYNFNKSFTTASGGACTDYQNWVIDTESNTAGATVDAKSGKVTATKTGSFKVKVQAYQNATKLAAGDVVESDWLTVNVKLAVVEAKQVADNKIQLTYNDNLTDATTPKAADVLVTNTETKAVSAVKSVSVDSTNKKLVTVTLWNALTDAKEYEVKVADFTQKVTASVGAVATVRIDTATVEKNVASEIKFTLLDANGIDVTTSKKTSSNMEVTVKTDKGYKDSTDKLTLYNTGDTAEVTVTYHTYTYDKAAVETGKVSATATVTATDKEVVGSYLKYTLATSTPNFDKDTMVSAIPAGKTYKVYVLAKKSNGDKYVTTVGATDSVVKKYTSSDSSVLLVNADGSVYGIKAGTAYVMAYDANDKIVWSFAVTVQEGTKATALTLATDTLTVSNKTLLKDTKTTKVVLKDQYNSDFDADLCALDNKYTAQASGAGIVVQPISKPDGATTLPTLTLPGKSNNNLSVSAEGVKAGTYKYLLAVKDSTNVRTLLTVVVQDANSISATVQSTYDLVVSTSEVDTTVGTSTNCTNYTDVTVKVGEYKNGVLVGYVSPSSSVKVELTTDSSKGAQDVTTADGVTTVKFASSSDSDNVVAKSTTGTYKVSATYTYTPSGASASTTVNLVKLVTVKDSQTAPSVSKEKDTTSAAATILDAVKACYKIDGMTIIDASVKCSIKDAKSTTVLSSGTTYQLYVESVTAVVPVKDNDGVAKKYVKMAVPVQNVITVNN